MAHAPGRPPIARDPRCAVGGSVVDDDDVRQRMVARELGEHVPMDASSLNAGIATRIFTARSRIA